MIRVLLALFANNLYSCANYAVLLLLIYEVMWKQRMKVVVVRTATFYWLMFATIAYLSIAVCNGQEFSSSTVCLRFVAPLIMFYIGYCRGVSGFEIIRDDLLVMGFSSFAHGIMNLVANRGVNVLLLHGRYYNDIYGGIISAIGQNLMFIICSPLLLYFLVCEKRKTIKTLGTLAAVGGLYGSIANASRTLLYVSAITFIVSILLYVYITHDMVTGTLRLAMIACGCLAAVMLASFLNFFNLGEWFSNTALGQREMTASASSSVENNLRWKYASDILRLLPSYPLGNIPYEHYAHNMWVDIAKEAGVIPFVGYIAFCVCALRVAILCIIEEKRYLDRVMFICTVTIAYFMIFFVEPLLEGSPITFCTFCFFIGALTAKRRHHILTSTQNEQSYRSIK